jgi:hypothetical protein
MPPPPLEYQRHDAIAAFLRHRAELRGAPLRVVPTRANTQPASRLLSAGRARSDRPPLRANRADARGRRDRGDHLVRRHRRLPPLRASTDPAEPLRLVRYRDAADPAIHVGRVQRSLPFGAERGALGRWQGTAGGAGSSQPGCGPASTIVSRSLSLWVTGSDPRVRPVMPADHAAGSQ